jgi:predicted amidohydrolase YtcJ
MTGPSEDRTLYRRALVPRRLVPVHHQQPAWQLAALLVVDGRIAWIGADREASDVAELAGTAVTDLDGALVLPAFVDAHVHVTETGLLLDGVSLSATRSVPELLDLVAAAAAARPGRQVLGHGWDELLLAEGRPPTAAELDRASGGAQVYLSRVDVHSAVVSSALAARAGLIGRPAPPRSAGWDASGRVERDAHHAVRQLTRFGLEPGERRALQLLALQSAAAAGIGELHEMSAPDIAPEEDLMSLLALRAGRALPQVVPYRGELAGDQEDARRIVARLSAAGLPWLAGLAGDLMVDGSFGSRTAALNHDYADAPGRRGHLYLTSDQVRDHVIACTQVGVQAGFHVIGDVAVDHALAGFEAAAQVVGLPALRAARHRIEHLEAVSPDGIAQVTRLGLIASVQPAFDAAWGGTSGMYAVRLGPHRATKLNPFAALVAAGVPLAFGSDSPVTPFDPWEGIRAALLHRTAEHRIEIGAAVHAHTAGRALRVGDPATFACWESPGLRAPGVPAADSPLAAVAAELAADEAAPSCVLTVIGGRVGFAKRDDALHNDPASLLSRR